MVTRVRALLWNRAFWLPVAAVTLLLISTLNCSDHRRRIIPPPPVDPCGETQTDVVYPVHHENPSWSVQGLLAFQDRGIVCILPAGAYVPDTSLAGLWVLEPVSGTKNRVRSTGYDPAWSPTGDMLAFEDNGQIFVMNSDGSNQRQLTAQGVNFYPAWHPDGNRITFDSNDMGASPFYSTWIIDADGANPRRLCPQQPVGDRQSSWHPAGIKYLHMRFVDASQSEEIFAADTTDCTDQPLTSNGYLARDPVYSPSGSQIAFTRIGDPPPAQIWIMNADGTGQRQLTQDGGSWPTWSPDGSQIAFTREDGRQSCVEQGVIWAVDVQSGVERQITSRWPSQCVGNRSVARTEGSPIVGQSRKSPLGRTSQWR